jgi:hypothetical protein
MAQGPRIFIVTDMEGVGGVNSWDEQTAPGQRRFDEARRLLAEAGAEDSASHGTLPADIRRLLQRATGAIQPQA